MTNPLNSAYQSWCRETVGNCEVFNDSLMGGTSSFLFNFAKLPLIISAYIEKHCRRIEISVRRIKNTNIPFNTFAKCLVKKNISK